MSNLLHPKFHRRNHHTYGNVANPDASHDPIASPESPFLGDFVLSGGLSACAPLSAYAGYFYSNNTAIIAESPNTAILIRGNATITGNLNVQGSANITGSSGNGSPVSVTLPSLSACSNAINIQNKYGVGLNIDNDTIKIINNALTVDTSRIPNSGNNNIPATTYNFSNGLVSQPTGSNSISVSAVLDNTSVRLTNGKISTNTYSFINGLSGFSVTSGVSSIGLKIDNSTIKLNGNGVLYSGFTASSGVAINNNSVYLNLDNKTICLNNFQQLTTGLKFPSIGGLALNNSTQEVSIQPDNITTRINSNNGKLQAFGFVSLGDVTPQAITSNLTTYGTLSATRGVTFSDGSTLTSVKNFKPTISKLANLKQNYYDGIVTTSDGRLVVWGSNDHFSAGGAGSCWPPQTLKFAGDYVLRNNLTITKVVHGLYVTAALLSDGTMWVSGYNNWGTSGSNSYGQLGVRKDSSGNVGYREFALQRVVGWPSGTPFITDFDVASSFSAGYVHLAAIDSSGQLYLWGFNLNGALGIGTTTQGIFNPTIASAPSGAFSSGVKQVALFMYGNSYANTLVLTNDGRVYAAGYQDYGQFGNGQAATLYSSFTQCFRAVGQPVANIAKIISSSGASFQTHFLLDTSGNVWAAGLNNQGQLADNTLTQSNYFKIIPGLTTVKDMGVSGASTYASMCAITANGNVYTWGYNGYGQLGTGDTTYRAAITQIPALNGLGSKVVSTSSDSGSTVIGVIGTDKFLYVAGHYAWGQYDTYSSVQSTFASLPLANVAEAEISSNRSTAIGMIIRDTYNRVFVVCSYNSDYFSGPNNSYARQPWEITNNLV